MNIFYLGITIVLFISTLGGLYRLIRGPHLLDRALALDFMSVVGVGAMALLFVTEDSPIALEIGIGLSFVGFFTALALSKFFQEERK